MSALRPSSIPFGDVLPGAPWATLRGAVKPSDFRDSTQCRCVGFHHNAAWKIKLSSDRISIERPPAGFAAWRPPLLFVMRPAPNRRGQPAGVSGDRYARRLMSLWRGPTDAAVNSHGRYGLQLLSVPSHWRAMGVLRVRYREDRSASRSHRRVHLGRQNASQDSLQDMWLRHALGAAGAHCGSQAWSEPRELRSQTHRLCARSSLRRSGHLEIHRRVGLQGRLALRSTRPATAGW